MKLCMHPFNDADRWTLANLRETFHTNGGDKDLACRDNQRFVLLGRTPDEDYDRCDEEVGSMWNIRFEDGTVISAFGEEIAEDTL